MAGKMKTKAIIIFSITFILLMTACGSHPDSQVDDPTAKSTALAGTESLSDSNPIEDIDKTEVQRTDQALSNAEAEDSISHSTPEGFSVIGGTWKVGGIYSRGHLIDIHDHDAIESMYSTTIITFNEDGSFVYLRTFNERGSWAEKDPGADDCFLMRTESSFVYDLQDGSLVEKETETTRQKQYLVTILDENTFALNEYDSITGKAKANDDPYYFVRQGTQSEYIADNKTGISKSTNQKTYTAPSKDEDTLSATQDKYKGMASSGEKNALEKARQYLDSTAFSYNGLIDQLEFEGFTSSEAQYGADHCGADWKEQAVKKAEEYLEYSSFSRAELLDQLVFEGFTQSQAEYGVDQAY